MLPDAPVSSLNLTCEEIPAFSPNVHQLGHSLVPEL